MRKAGGLIREAWYEGAATSLPSLRLFLLKLEAGKASGALDTKLEMEMIFSVNG